MVLARFRLVIVLSLCAACGVEKGAALTEAPVGVSSHSGKSAGQITLDLSSRVAVFGDEVYAISGDTIYHANAALDDVTAVKKLDGATLYDLGVGLDRVVYTRAGAAGSVQIAWTRLDGQGGSTIGSPLTRPAGGVSIVSDGTHFYSIYDQNISQWDSSANTVSLTTSGTTLAGAVVAAGQLFVSKDGVYAADVSKTPPTLTQAAPDAFAANATANGDVFYYSGSDKVFGYDAAAKKAIAAFDAAGVVAAAGDAGGVYWMTASQLFEHGTDGTDTPVGAVSCTDSTVRLLITTTHILVDCPLHFLAFGRP